MEAVGIQDAVTVGLTEAGIVGMLVGAILGLALGGVMERVPAEWGLLTHYPMTRRLLACLFLGTAAFGISALAGGGEPWWHAAVTAASTGARYWVLPWVRTKLKRGSASE